MQVKKKQVEPDMEQWTGSKLGRVQQDCILSPCLFNLYAVHIMWNARLDELQVEIKIARRSINNLRYADDTTLMAESKEELKSLLMRVKKKSEKAGFFNETKIMTSDPITSWQIEGGKSGSSDRFSFLGLQNHWDGNCSHEIKTCLFLGRKAMINLKHSILNSRNITLLTKVCIVINDTADPIVSQVWIWELDHKED